MNTEELIKEFQGKIEELKKVNKDQAPSREEILKYIYKNLASRTQWLNGLVKGDGTDVYEVMNASKYACKAEALIELLEGHDCGSWGGFDPEVGSPYGLRTLDERYKALCRKYSQR